MKLLRHPLIKNEKRYLLAAFFLPLAIMAIAYLTIGIYPGSTRSVLASDAFSQFANFHASFKRMMTGDGSIFYSWNGALGLNYYALISYYLGGLFTPLVIFFPLRAMPDALYFLTLIKIGSAGLAFWFFARLTFKLPSWLTLALANCYALMSFTIAQSELIMWLDTFVYLPLIILGIHRLMDQRKPVVLFVSYLLLFVSNYYFGFMVGLFSVLYYLARLFVDFKRKKNSFFLYVTTSLLAGISSFIMVLPAVLDLRTNGEELSTITRFKTEDTNFWDLIVKNMVGVFDTTKYHSIPFLYIGLIPLIFCLFFFLSTKFRWQEKVAFGSIFALLIASFYIEPLNLFWQGMHSPNMFLFRYSFLFSFLVITLAARGLEKFERSDQGELVATILFLMGLFILAKGTLPKAQYTYVTNENFYYTLLFLALYLVAIVFYQLKQLPMKHLAKILLALMILEAGLNTSSMLNGILGDWNYASRSLFTKPYKAYQDIVDPTRADNQKSFSRTESLDTVSTNDSFTYGFNGISLFSSIRNRHSSSMLNQLGFRSRGTNLNLRYANNTLLMDSLFDVKYNVAKNDIQKYGFTQVDSNASYKLFKNSQALGLGILTNKGLNSIKLPTNDNLGSQTALVNQLANLKEKYFTFTEPKQVSATNTKISTSGSTVTYAEETSNIGKSITWSVYVPANKQAYFSLFPSDFTQVGSSSASITVNGITTKSEIGITGQYYNLGYYPTGRLITFTSYFYGTQAVSFVKPLVLFMDTNAYHTAMSKLQKQSVNFKVSGRKARATVSAKKAQQLFTTIPYDKGWHAKIDGKTVPLKSFKDSFILLDIPKGTHTVELSFLPRGLIVGILCFVVGIASFSGLVYWQGHSKKRRRE